MKTQLITEIVNTQNIAAIKEATLDLLEFIKSKKIYISNEYIGDTRIKGSLNLLIIYRAIHGDRFDTITAADEYTRLAFVARVDTIADLVHNNTGMLSRNINDFKKDTISAKLTREIIPHLEPLYMQGQINLNDIAVIYHILNKPAPRKFQFINCDNSVYPALLSSITTESQNIKANMITHYDNLVKRIDCDGDIKEFVKAARLLISDIGAIRMCVGLKFDNDRFIDMVDAEFENMVRVASSRIADKAPDGNNVQIKRINQGGKGFDISCVVNDKPLYARAIEVEGNFVRFHYRYIVS